MHDRLNTLLDMVGLEHNSVQVNELDRGGYMMLYPNFFTTRDEIKIPKTDEELLLQIEDIISAHYIAVKNDLDMVRRFRQELESGKETK